MTYESDPTRWTQTPREAPDSLRAVFDAGRREGPSDAQMRSLALKLAALGGGAAVAATASAAHASTAAVGGGGAVAGGGMLSLSKVAVSIALIGAAATGSAFLRRSETPDLAPRSAVQTEIAHAPVAAVPEQEAAPIAQPTATPTVTSAPAARTNTGDVAPSGASGQPSLRGSTHGHGERAARATSDDDDRDAVTTRERSRRHDTRASSTRAISTMSTTHARSARAEPQPRTNETRANEASAGEAPHADEIDLLRRARSALAARPREAFRLTEQHRSEYPTGVFTQERDALAVEALLRSGELKLARELAEAFVRRYPSSPHAHRFRETMNLQ